MNDSKRNVHPDQRGPIAGLSLEHIAPFSLSIENDSSVVKRLNEASSESSSSDSDSTAPGNYRNTLNVGQYYFYKTIYLLSNSFIICTGFMGKNSSIFNIEEYRLAVKVSFNSK